MKKHYFLIFPFCPLWRPKGISQLVTGLGYITRDIGCYIHIGDKLYYLGRAKMFSSTATNFGVSSICTPHWPDSKFHWLEKWIPLCESTIFLYFEQQSTGVLNVPRLLTMVCSKAMSLLLFCSLYVLMSPCCRPWCYSLTKHHLNNPDLTGIRLL